MMEMTLFENLNNIYNVNCKSADLFKKQLDLISEPIVIADFLSKHKVHLLCEIERAKPEFLRQGRPTADYTEVTVDSWQEPEQNLLQSRLRDILGSFSVWGGNYYTTTVPYLPHVDNGTDIQELNYRNIVMPWDFEPAVAKTYVILFKQRYFGNNTGFYASGEGGDVEFTCNESLYDYSRVLYLDKGHQIPGELLETHLSHVKPEDLKGLSVSHIIPWTVGSCIIFDSAQIHCSSNFYQQKKNLDIHCLR